MNTHQSGSGFRSTLRDAHGEPYVSIWAWTEGDAELMAHEANMRHYEAMEAWRSEMERRFARQQAAEFRKIRARA